MLRLNAKMGCTSRRALRASVLFGLLSFAAGSSAQSGGVNAVLAASRTSGTAPLAVNFSAQGTTIAGVAEPFGEGLYHVDFDDPDAGTWPISGRSRGEEYGPEVGHVFDRPGIYDVQLTVRAPNGTSDTETVRITVANPETTFAGTRTVCISTSGNFSGCPATALRFTSSTVALLNSAIVDNRRVLLRCGERWSGTTAVTIPRGVDTGHLGSYGGCGNARITSSGSQVILANGDDWRVTDLDLDAPSGNTDGISRGAANHLLISRVHVLHARTGIETPGGYRDAATAGRHMILADSTFHGIRHNGMYLMLWSAALLGNTVEDTSIGEHNIRLPWWERVQISHGRYTRPGGIRHTLKAVCNPDPPLECNRLVFSFNQAIGHTNQWMVDVGPMDDAPANGVELGAYYIIEHNWLRSCDGAAGCNTQRPIMARWRYGYIRHNVIDVTGRGGSCIQVQRRGLEPNPQHFRVYNNTCFRADGPATGVGISTVDDITVANNFTVTHTGTPTSMSASGATNTRYSNNVTSTSTSAFVDSTPGSAVTDFRINGSSSACNAGTTPPAAWVDYDLREAPAGAYDCGAFEYAQ